MEAETALVWAEGGVELDSVSAVDLDLVLVIFPDDAELNDALGDGNDFEGGSVFGFLLEEGAVFEGRGQLWGEKLAWGWVAVAWRRCCVCLGNSPLAAHRSTTR